jgi:hypothetical protein
MPLTFKLTEDGYLPFDSGVVRTVGKPDSVEVDHALQSVAHTILTIVGENPWNYAQGLDILGIQRAIDSVTTGNRADVIKDYITVALAQEPDVFDQPIEFFAVEGENRDWTITMTVLTKTEERVELETQLMGGLPV